MELGSIRNDGAAARFIRYRLDGVKPDLQLCSSRGPVLLDLLRGPLYLLADSKLDLRVPSSATRAATRSLKISGDTADLCKSNDLLYRIPQVVAVLFLLAIYGDDFARSSWSLFLRNIENYSLHCYSMVNCNRYRKLT